jgi:hypothetical protein
MDQPDLISMGPASNQHGAFTDHQAQKPIVEFALFRQSQVRLVPVLPALTIDVRNSTSGYALQ